MLRKVEIEPRCEGGVFQTFVICMGDIAYTWFRWWCGRDSYHIKGEIYRACVQSVSKYVTEK